MIQKIKKQIDQELSKFIKDVKKDYSLDKISPLLYSSIKDFILRDGKRIRPIFFVISYLGFCKKRAKNLIRSSLSIELLHDFMLIHDDIIDKSDTRRGKPSMHKMINNYLERFPNLKFSGQDLSIVVGDIIYAIAINSFLEIKEDPLRKEQALRKFVEAALFTGSGEFIELLAATLKLNKLTLRQIYKIYDYKTGNYTFSTPLIIGATLAGASDIDKQKLKEYGILLGRAFQIKDDILGIFANQKDTGKSQITDIQEEKRTILIWSAYQNSSKENKEIIEQILTKQEVTKQDINTIKKIIEDSGALKFAKEEISNYLAKSQQIMKTIKMKNKQKEFFIDYSSKLLEVNF